MLCAIILQSGDIPLLNVNGIGRLVVTGLSMITTAKAGFSPGVPNSLTSQVLEAEPR